MPEFSPSMSPPEAVLVSNLKDEEGVAVDGFSRLVIETVKSRGG